MPQFIRTAGPMGDYRSFKPICVQSGGVQNGNLILISETVAMVFLGELILDSQGCPRSPQVVDVGEEFVAVYHCEKIRVCKHTGSGQAFAVGDKIYFSGIYGDCVSHHASGYYWIGICAQPAAEDDSYVVIDLKGDKATLLE
jgi:hypothetical protein